MMKLGQVLDQIDTLSDYDTIFAKRPWNFDSEALVGPLELTDTYRVPKSVTDRGFEYFLEVHLAQQLLQDFRSKLHSAADRRELLIHYAENDAYPEWAYKD
jgi:hypothetical protein